MLEVSVTSNIDKVVSSLGLVAQKQIPFAASLAINQCASLAIPALQYAMLTSFDRPKPYTLNSLFIKRSTKTNLQATIFHSDRVAPYILPELVGGTRSEKAFEINIAGNTGVLVPTKNIKLDSYGNVSKAMISKMLSLARSPDARTEYVLVRPGESARLSPGIYRRVNGKIIALMLFKPNAKYNPRYDMKGVVAHLVASEFDKQFAAALEYALSTAK